MEWLNDIFRQTPTAEPTSQYAILAALIFVGLIADRVAVRLILALLRNLASRSRGRWDDLLVDHGVFERLSHLAPALIILIGIDVLALDATPIVLLRRVAAATIVVVVLRTVGAFLNAVNDIYNTFAHAKDRPIKGYLQVIKLVAFLLGTVMVVAILLDRSPMAFLTGIGALSAVLLLVFKDTLLSLVASVQLMSNDLIRVGDWIEVPGYGADGDVTDIALHTIKVQNFDKTTTTIPTYALINNGFKNWRTMPESGGRRIKRSVCLDAHGIRYLDDREVERFGQWRLLASYIAAKNKELAEYNVERRPEHGDVRRLTNIGTLRAYVVNYLADHPDINKDLTCLVRLLEPSAAGVPLQVYCFANKTGWVDFEAVQSDIFEHILAILPEFGLKVFQNPSGSDFRLIARPDN